MMRLEGAKELAEEFKALPPKVQRKMASQALREGAQILKSAVQGEAPVRTGVVKGDVRVLAGRGSKGITAIRVVLGKGKAFYVGFVEEGHFMGKRVRLSRAQSRRADREQLYRAKSIAAGRAFVEGKHFAQRAYNQSAGAAAQAASEKLVQLLDEELNHPTR